MEGTQESTLTGKHTRVNGVLDEEWNSRLILPDLTIKYLLMTPEKGDIERGSVGPA